MNPRKQFPRKGLSWYVAWTRPDGKRASRIFGTFREAFSWWREPWPAEEVES